MTTHDRAMETPQALRAFELNDYEVWVAASAEAACAQARRMTGGAYDPSDARELSDDELDATILPDESGAGACTRAATTLRLLLTTRRAPGFLARYELARV